MLVFWYMLLHAGFENQAKRKRCICACVCAGNGGFPEAVQKASAAWKCLDLQVWSHNLHTITFYMFRACLGRMAFLGCRVGRGGQVLLVPQGSWYVFVLTNSVKVAFNGAVSMALKSLSLSYFAGTPWHPRWYCKYIECSKYHHCSGTLKLCFSKAFQKLPKLFKSQLCWAGQEALSGTFYPSVTKQLQTKTSWLFFFFF